MSTYIETVRGSSRGRSGAAASPSVSILSDLNSPGGVQTTPARKRWGLIWLSGVVVAAGIAAGVLLLGQTTVGSTGAQVAANAVADQRARVASNRPMEADFPRVLKNVANAEPRGVSSVLVSSSGTTASDEAASIRADQAALEPPMNEVPSPRENAVKKHEVRSSGGRASGNVVPSRRERSGGVAARSNSKKTEQKFVSKRPKDGERLVVNKRGSSDAVKPKPEAPRLERDVDIITAIVR